MGIISILVIKRPTYPLKTSPNDPFPNKSKKTHNKVRDRSNVNCSGGRVGRQSDGGQRKKMSPMMDWVTSGVNNACVVACLEWLPMRSSLT